MTDISGMLAGNPFAWLRKKRAGQWSDRARIKRMRRLAKAQVRRDRERSVRRAWHPIGRAKRREMARDWAALQASPIVLPPEFLKVKP